MSNSAAGCILVVLVALTMILPPSSDSEPNLTNGLIKEDFASLQYSFPVAQGWSFEKLSRALLYAREIGSTAVIVLHDGKVVLEWGKTTLRIKSHSVRKSLLSALYGISVEKGLIDLNATISDIGFVVAFGNSGIDIHAGHCIHLAWLYVNLLCGTLA